MLISTFLKKNHFKYIWKIALIGTLIFFSACTKDIHNNFLSSLNDDIQARDSSFPNIVRSMKYNDTLKYLLVGNESGYIDIWDMNKARSKQKIKAHEHRITSLTFTSNGKGFFSNSLLDSEVKLWDTKTGKLLHIIPGSRGPIVATPDENIYVISNSGKYYLFDSSKKLALLEEYDTTGHGSITAMTMDKSSGLIAIGTQEGVIDVLQYENHASTPMQETDFGEEPKLRKLTSVSINSNMGKIVGLHFTRDGKSLYSVSRFGLITQWNNRDYTKTQSFMTALRHISSAKFNYQENILALTGTTNKNGVNKSGYVAIVSLDKRATKLHLLNTSSTVSEFIQPLSYLIVSQRGYMGTYRYLNKRVSNE